MNFNSSGGCWDGYVTYTNNDNYQYLFCNNGTLVNCECSYRTKHGWDCYTGNLIAECNYGCCPSMWGNTTTDTCNLYSNPVCASGAVRVRAYLFLTLLLIFFI